MASALAAPDMSRGRPSTALPKANEAEAQLIVRELAAVADYVARMKQEIGALRPNELYRDRIPLAHEELGGVKTATASATNAIMAAAERILEAQGASLETYRSEVEARVLEIFEACSFQDITGQRLAKVAGDLEQLEKRLARFASAVNARDAMDAVDPEEARQQARREALMLHGPQADGQGVAQDEIDKLFA